MSVITNARSRLQNGSVLVWLLGDERIIRADTRVFFRRATVADDGSTSADKTWQEGDLKYSDAEAEMDSEEISYAQVLQHINEFLPVKELAGKVIGVPVLRQFGLVENEKFDSFLTTAFSAQLAHDEKSAKPKKVLPKSSSMPAQK